MKRFKPLVLFTVAIAWVADSSVAQVTATPGKTEERVTGKPDKSEMHSDEMMRKIEAAARPGPEHKVLEPLVGEWNAEIKFWTATDTSALPTSNSGTSTLRWILDGRFIQEDFDGAIWGRPYHGMGVIGYDKMKGRYVTGWIDSMSTALFTAEGVATDGGTVITFTGRSDCPVTGEKDIPIKTILRIMGPDRHTFELHDPRGGEQSKTMEIIYTRK